MLTLQIISLVLGLIVHHCGSVPAEESDIDSYGCPTKPIVVVYSGGLTANTIWEYITVYFVAKYLPNHKPYSTRRTNRFLGPVFDNVSLPVIEDVPKYCDCIKDVDDKTWNTHIWEFIPLKEAKDKFANVTHNVILDRCTIFVEPMATPEHIREIKQVLPYKKLLVDEAQHSLEKIKQEYYQRSGIRDNITFVAVHVRRTDFLPFISTQNFTYVGAEFFKIGMEFFRRRRNDLGNPIFVVASDDYEWCMQNLNITNDIFILGGDAAHPGKDLVLLSSCNHAVFDYGTYGLWSALYTEGHVVTSFQGVSQQFFVLHKNPKWHFVVPKTLEFKVPPY